MSTQSQLQSLSTDPWYGDLASQLAVLHAEMGSPEPGVGPSTDTLAPFSAATIENVGEWGGYEWAVVTQYNEALDTLFSAIDIHAAGGGQYYTTAAYFKRHPADARWSEFQNSAKTIIKEWLNESV